MAWKLCFLSNLVFPFKCMHILCVFYNFLAWDRHFCKKNDKSVEKIVNIGPNEINWKSVTLTWSSHHTWNLAHVLPANWSLADVLQLSSCIVKLKVLSSWDVRGKPLKMVALLTSNCIIISFYSCLHSRSTGVFEGWGWTLPNASVGLPFYFSLFVANSLTPSSMGMVAIGMFD